MNEWERLRKRAEVIKKQYPQGTRVQLTRMDDMQAPPIGTLGTVMGVDDIGTIMVLWDTGGTLGVTDVDECVKI
jgi:hypothetical protein